jgi:prevent-host-death family protein
VAGAAGDEARAVGLRRRRGRAFCDRQLPRSTRLVERAAAGEEIIIAKAGRPRARLVPLVGRAEPRQPGGWEGRVWVAEDFDEPLPADVLGGKD